MSIETAARAHDLARIDFCGHEGKCNCMPHIKSMTDWNVQRFRRNQLNSLQGLPTWTVNNCTISTLPAGMTVSRTTACAYCGTTGTGRCEGCGARR